MLNQFQINSCEQATAAVAAMWPWASNEGAQSAVCKSLGRRRGCSQTQQQNDINAITVPKHLL
ncbi:hypothetical protein H2136_20580 [Aeromonas hydrophila]|uniref:Uncharacterized protein n=1 Tax=Aeromonas hydrophila TaxID=644 RepID=A0A926FME1_AERHY|nr:hypothetical protein [Aeromonas hydrophila]